MSKRTRIITTHSSDETAIIGRRLGRFMPAGAVIAAYGDLGCGKTCFAAGLARGLGVEDKIISPTYIFFRIYPGERHSFAHIDAYRLEGLEEEEIAQTGLEECFGRENAVFAEWPGYIEQWLPEDMVELHMEQGAGQNERLLEFVYDTEKNRWIDEAFSY